MRRWAFILYSFKRDDWLNKGDKYLWEAPQRLLTKTRGHRLQLERRCPEPKQLHTTVDFSAADLIIMGGKKLLQFSNETGTCCPSSTVVTRQMKALFSRGHDWKCACSE